MAKRSCEHCGTVVPAGADQCPRCHRNPAKPQTSRWWIAGLIGIIVVCLFSLLPDGRGPAVVQPAAPAVPSPRTDAVAVLSVPDGGDVPVCPTAEALDRFTQLAIAKDGIGVEQMGAAGLLWAIPSGTSVRVIDLGILTSEIRILDGSHSGRSGFVSADFVTAR